MKQDTAMRDIPVIILTAKDKMKDLFELEGITGCLVKLFKAKDFLKMIEEYLTS